MLASSTGGSFSSGTIFHKLWYESLHSEKYLSIQKKYLSKFLQVSVQVSGSFSSGSIFHQQKLHFEKYLSKFRIYLYNLKQIFVFILNCICPSLIDTRCWFHFLKRVLLLWHHIPQAVVQK